MSTLGIQQGYIPTTAQVTVATGTATALVAASTSLNRRSPNGVVVKAMAANSATVLIGASGVTTGTGYELSAGNSVTVPVADPSLIFGISGTSSQKVCLLY